MINGAEVGGREKECDKKQGKGKSQSLELDWKEKCEGGMKTGQQEGKERNCVCEKRWVSNMLTGSPGNY